MNYNFHKKTLIIAISGVVVVIALAILLWFSYATKGTSEEVETIVKRDSTALCVAVMPTLDCLPAMVAYDDSLFKAANANVFIETFASQMDCDTALIGGSAHLAFTDVIRAQRLIRKKVAIDYYSKTPLSWKFITNPRSRVREMKDMEEKLVGITRFSGTDFLAELAIDSAKMKREKVFRVQINDLNIRLSMLLNNELDGVLLPEPYATEASNHNNKVLYDFARNSFSLGTIVMRKDLIADSTEVDRFALGYNMAVDSINKNGIQHYRETIKKYFNVKSSTIDSLKQMRFEHVTPVNASDKILAQKWLDKH
ncbi:MAG: ABC transporter substrate-binding protein [Bacteroidaceae bacterium]|nr:ABC transporter substrate-binding protein [Bacteroidaceae bacterium]